MKLPSSNVRTSRGEYAFTFVEALIASTTLVILVASVIMCNLYGLAMAKRQAIWLGASSDAVQAIGTLTADIRSAVSMQVGSYQSGAFTQCSITNSQTGSALMIFSTSNSTPWTLYYYDTVTSNLYRTNYNGPGVSGDYKMVSANPITNDSTRPIFSELDTSGMGTLITNYNSLAPVSIYLSFIKLQNPQVIIEDGSLVDLYQLTTTVTPRLVLTQ
jgi:hypothetical protein